MSNAHGLDLPKLLGPCVGDPVPQQFFDAAALYKSLSAKRYGLTDSMIQFLFFLESDLERAVNDTGAMVRRSLADAGWGSVADSLLGEAPKRPEPHARWDVTYARGVTQTDVTPLTEAPPRGELPKLMPLAAPSPGQVQLAALHLHEKINEDSAVSSDLRVHAVFPSHPDVPKIILKFVNNALKSLVWLSSAVGDPHEFKQAYLDAFPHVAEFCQNFFRIGGLSIKTEKMDKHTTKIHLSVPVDHDAAYNYNLQIAEAFNLFDPFHVELRHPHTDALLLDFRMAAGEVHITVGIRGEKLAWMGSQSDTAVLEWDADEFIEVHAVVDFSLVPLGVTLAAIPFPKMRLQCMVDRAGAMLMRCIGAEETALDTLASCALDMQQFRKLLLEEFRVELQHSNALDGPDESIIVYSLRMLFPSNSVSTLLAQWFEEVVVRKLTETDPFKAFAELFAAFGQDAAQLSHQDG